MAATDDKYGPMLDGFAAEGRLRRIPGETSGVIDLCSNDYLGLAARGEELAREFIDSCGLLPFTSSASRLLSRRQREYSALEGQLGELYGKHALIFNSGYHANCGAISALAAKGVAVYADRLSHASMIDGLVLSRSRFERFRHNDTDHLRSLLERDKDSELQLVVTESIFSMDGDEAPLRRLVEMKRDFPRMAIYLDEAHGFGVRGERGLGLAEELGLTDDVDIIIGTFGKAAASSGAFVAASRTIRDFLLNSARSFIFSTAIPPVNVAYTRFIIGKILHMQREREHLRHIGECFRAGIAAATGTEPTGSSQIVPWIIGDAARAVEISARLLDAGFDALAIRRPTVPPNGERIRFSLNATLTEQQLSPLMKIIESESKPDSKL